MLVTGKNGISCRKSPPSLQRKWTIVLSVSTQRPTLMMLHGVLSELGPTKAASWAGDGRECTTWHARAANTPPESLEAGLRLLYSWSSARDCAQMRRVSWWSCVESVEKRGRQAAKVQWRVDKCRYHFMKLDKTAVTLTWWSAILRRGSNKALVVLVGACMLCRKE